MARKPVPCMELLAMGKLLIFDAILNFQLPAASELILLRGRVHLHDVSMIQVLILWTFFQELQLSVAQVSLVKELDPVDQAWPASISPSPKGLELEYDHGEKFCLAAEFLWVYNPSADSMQTMVIFGRRHVHILGIEPMGKYGVRAIYDDTHDTGISTWTYLHDLGSEKFYYMLAYIKSPSVKEWHPPSSITLLDRVSGETEVKQSVALALTCIFLASLPSILGVLPLCLTVLVQEGGTLLVCLNSARAYNDPIASLGWKKALCKLVNRSLATLVLLFRRENRTPVIRMARSHWEGESQEEKEKRERRNFRRRKSYQEKSQQQQREELRGESERLIEEAKQQCQSLLTAARYEAERLSRETTRQAELSLQQIEAECSDGKGRLLALREGIARKEAALQALERQLHPPNCDNPRPQPAADPYLAAEFRRKDAARKRAAYWSNRETGRRPSRSLQLNLTGQNEGDELPNRKRRCIDRIVSKITSDLLRYSEKFNFAAKKLVLERLWLHSSLKEYQPATLGSPKCDAAVAAAMADLKKTLQVVKCGSKKDHLATKFAVLVGMTGQCTVGKRYQSSLAKAFGLKRHNFQKAAGKRRLIDGDRSIRYPMGERKTRSDKISAEVRKIVESFWEANTRISPNKKDIVNKRLAPKLHEQHQVHWLEDTEVEFFLRFCEWCKAEDNGVCIGLRSFQYLKPYYIRTMKDRNVCCCKEHVQMDLLKEAINRFRKHFHPQDCICTCPTCRSAADEPTEQTTHCRASKTLITSVRGWMEGALCPRREGQQWHKKKCIMGNCNSCGVNTLPWCQMELDDSRSLKIDWESFKYVDLEETAQVRREQKKGTSDSRQKKLRRLRMVPMRASLPEFKSVVLDTMAGFIIHNFRARWQAEQFKLCLKTFPRGTIVSSIDYSENYTFKMQNEIQTQHWDNRQITLLIHVTYRHREDVSTVEASVGRCVRMAQDDVGDRDIIADYHFYVSDDNKHDTLFVQHCMDAHWHWMQQEGIAVKQHWVWSDGAASQFKGCRPFYYVSRYYKRFGARMKWFFHASGHGKGVADALGGHIKSGIEKEQLRGIDGHKMENAADAVAFCREKFAMGQVKEYGDVQLVRRLFWEIPVGAVNRQKKWDCDPIPGTRKLHCFDGFSPRLSTLLQVRELCYFCHHCIDDEPAKCESKQWTGPFRLEMVKGVLPSDVQADVQGMGVGEGGEDVGPGLLADLVQLGDYYAVKAEVPNKWDVEFYICQCEETVTPTKKKFVDGYDVSFEKDDLAVRGSWFQPVPGRNSTYCYNKSAPPSYCHADSIVHIRFGLTPCQVGKGGARYYTLDFDTMEAISESLI